jgi:phospholipid transport system substrate-binding protein
MHRQKDEWKVYDVAVDGISLLATYRSEFRAAIQRDGLDGLIAALAQKNASGQVDKGAVKS